MSQIPLLMPCWPPKTWGYQLQEWLQKINELDEEDFLSFGHFVESMQTVVTLVEILIYSYMWTFYLNILVVFQNYCTDGKGIGFDKSNHFDEHFLLNKLKHISLKNISYLSIKLVLWEVFGVETYFFSRWRNKSINE